MSKEKKVVEEKKSTFAMSMIMLLVCIVIIAYGIIGCGFEAHVPITMSIAVLLVYGMAVLKISYTELGKSMMDSMAGSLECMFIILVIGATVGTWVSSGVVPYIIVLGLHVFSPKFFFVSILIICCLMSMCTGSSWTTMGTVGVAFMGVGVGLGVNPAITAGAIICGAYFGDKQSPLSDTTNFAAAVSKTNLYAHVRSMLYTTGPAILVSAVIFLVLGLRVDGNADTSTVTELIDGLNGAFHFSPVLLLPLVLMIVLIVIKFPALQTLLLCSIVGMVFTIIFQGRSLIEAGTYWYSGYVGETGNETIDKLLTRGGMSGMWYTVVLMMVGLSMGGLMIRTGIVRDLMEKVGGVTKSRAGLIIAHLISGYILSFIASDPYLTMLIPAEAFGEGYDNLGLDRSVMSRTCEDGATIVAPMVPWGSNGVYTATTLGVATASYIPFYLMGFINPIFVIICAVTGFGCIKAKKEEA